MLYLHKVSEHLKLYWLLKYALNISVLMQCINDKIVFHKKQSRLGNAVRTKMFTQMFQSRPMSDSGFS